METVRRRAASSGAPDRAGAVGRRCSRCGSTVGAARAWWPPPRSCRWRRSTRAGTPRRSRASGPSAWAPRSSPTAGSTTGPSGPTSRSPSPTPSSCRTPPWSTRWTCSAGCPPRPSCWSTPSRSFDELGLAEFAAGFRPDRLLTCPATALALEHLGRPLPNAALLGGFAALTGRITLGALETAIGERFPGAVGAANVAAARAAYRYVVDEGTGSSGTGEVVARAAAD